ncbi:MAG: Hsp20 family protein [Candidatus Sedimenticola endophacoides]
MNAIDFTPLFRTAIGFDRLTEALESAYRADATGGYPPYNIELTGEDRYRITMAVAGFRDEDFDIEVKQNILRVRGARKEENGGAKYLYRGIATRSFERNFQLADYVRVEGAELRDGLLHIDLAREIPEAMRPRRIEIRSDRDSVIEDQSQVA